MTAGSTTLHEEGLPPDVIDRHRAIVSMKQELEAVVWYDQSAAVAADPDVAAVVGHTRDEEHEHFVMNAEWLRRHDTNLDKPRRSAIFTDPQDIIEVEKAAEHGGDEGSPGAESTATNSLRVGNLRNETEGTL